MKDSELLRIILIAEAKMANCGVRVDTLKKEFIDSFCTFKKGETVIYKGQMVQIQIIKFFTSPFGFSYLIKGTGMNNSKMVPEKEIAKINN